MKKVTITVDDDVFRWAKAWAAQNNTSLSRMLGEELRKKMNAERNYDLAMQRFLSKSPRMLKTEEASYPSHDSLYER